MDTQPIKIYRNCPKDKVLKKKASLILIHCPLETSKLQSYLSLQMHNKRHMGTIFQIAVIFGLPCKPLQLARKSTDVLGITTQTQSIKEGIPQGHGYLAMQQQMIYDFAVLFCTYNTSPLVDYNDLTFPQVIYGMNFPIGNRPNKKFSLRGTLAVQMFLQGKGLISWILASWKMIELWIYPFFRRAPIFHIHIFTTLNVVSSIKMYPKENIIYG